MMTWTTHSSRGVSQHLKTQDGKATMTIWRTIGECSYRRLPASPAILGAPEGVGGQGLKNVALDLGAIGAERYRKLVHLQHSDRHLELG